MSEPDIRRLVGELKKGGRTRWVYDELIVRRMSWLGCPPLVGESINVVAVPGGILKWTYRPVGTVMAGARGRSRRIKLYTGCLVDGDGHEMLWINTETGTVVMTDECYEQHRTLQISYKHRVREAGGSVEARNGTATEVRPRPARSRSDADGMRRPARSASAGIRKFRPRRTDAEKFRSS